MYYPIIKVVVVLESKALIIALFILINEPKAAKY